MNRNKVSLGIAAIAFAMVFLPIQNNSVSAVKCEDIKHEGDNAMKWGGTSHGDNNPSESKFNKMVEGSASTCEVAKCYDHDECKGEITKSEWKDFKKSIVFMGTTEDVQDCLKDRFDLPNDDGDKHLADYEIHHCAVGSY